MIAIQFIFCDVINDNGIAALPDFMADCRFNLQLATGLKAEGDLIEHIAGNPPVLSHSCDSRKTHSGAATDHFQHGFHSRDSLNSVYVRLKAS
jgi:hypothetical protein